jgi:hypothetical protein
MVFWFNTSGIIKEGMLASLCNIDRNGESFKKTTGSYFQSLSELFVLILYHVTTHTPFTPKRSSPKFPQKIKRPVL